MLATTASLRSSSSVAAAVDQQQVIATNSCNADNSSSSLYTLTSKRKLSPNSYLLRYSLPTGRKNLSDDLTIPTCIKILYPDGTDAKTGNARPLEKSYSPVSHPNVEGYMDLIVKAYPPRPGGGVGDYLCNMNVGEMIHGTVKGKRIMHGSASVLNRWNNIGLIAGGTGIAPLLQVARIVLESQDPVDTSTSVHLLFINCNEEDILARDEIEDLASKHSERFHVTYSLTSPTNNSDPTTTSSWKGNIGRGDMAIIKTALPPPTNDEKTMILVCGTDGFVASWAGPVGRAPKNPDGSKGAKIQGPLLGLLKEAGYTAEEVFKY